MRAALTVSYSFPAGHTLAGHPLCGRPHGHQWRLDVTLAQDEDPKQYGMPVDEVLFDAEITRLVKELEYRDLNVMIKPAVASPVGLAHWFMERLVIHYPSITEVKVWRDEELSVSLSR